MLTTRLIKTKLLIGVLVLMCCRQSVKAQINFTANDWGHVPSYSSPFLYGTNGGYYYTWDDKSLADIAAGNPSKGVAGVGSKTFRPSLPDSFVMQYSYDIRLQEFAYYASLGARDHTVFLGSDPTNSHRDWTHYTGSGCDTPSYAFRNLYEPIWDNGANGTPVNDSNYFAVYIYEVVRRYKPYVKFWEIINEPDQNGGKPESWEPPGVPGNWWENVPQPCQLDNLHMPFFFYIRMLRIAYEVIKYLDPNAYVAPGGIGSISFLDAMLRYTDNPVDGSVTGEYPNKGGAYFDVLSFHSYPMWVLRSWDISKGPIGPDGKPSGDWDYRRHSDAAVDVTIQLKESMDSVLGTRGYNGSKYPKKPIILTETGVPIKPVDWLLGSVDASRNYTTKLLVESQQHDIKQTYIYELGNVINSWETPVQIHDLMGLYEKLENIGPINSLGENTGIYRQQYTAGGIAFKTTSDLLGSSHYDAGRTAMMNLPANVMGATFTDNSGNHTYVLWARTSIDYSEVAAALYSFPAAMNVSPQLDKKNWNYSATSIVSPITPTNIVLTGDPIYITENLSALPLPDPDSLRNDPRPEKKFAVSLYPNPASSAAAFQFTLTSPATVNLNVYDATGKWIMSAVNAQKFATGTHVIPINVAGHLSPGVYYFRFETDAQQVMKKLVIVK